jgi:MFS family permease
MSIDVRKIGRLAAVYIGQAIAPGFATFAMPVLLRRQGVTLQAVGLTGLLLLPAALKFVWGPWTDRLAARGRTRTWLTGLQTALVVCVAGLVVFPPARGVAPFLVLVGTSYLLVAVADVITDGLALRLLAREERPLGNAAQYGGAYAGSILAGGLFLAIEPRLGWAPAVAFLVMLVAAGWVAARTLPIPAPAPVTTAVDAAAARASLLAFLRGPVARHVLPLLLLLDFPQNVGIALVGPFLLDDGLTQAQVGLVSGTAGLAAALAGAVLGGIMLARLSRRRGIVVAGALQAVPLVGLAWMAATPAVSLPVAFAVVCAAYFTASVFNVTLSSWFMDLASPRQPGTDYSVMACAHIGTFAIAGPIAGAIASRFGFTAYFLGTAAVALVFLALAVPWLRALGSLGASADARTVIIGAD